MIEKRKGNDMTGKGPDVECRRLDGGVDLENRMAAVSAFDRAERVSMGQAWRECPDQDFRPATVCSAWTGASLLVYAELEDDDIFNPVTAFNEPAFPKAA